MHGNNFLTYIAIVFLAWCAGGVYEVSAYMPQIVEQQSLHDITLINSPLSTQVFYGTLSGFPHTYEIKSDVPFIFSAEIRVPDIEGQKNTVSGIIIKDKKRGRVEEITRLSAGGTDWEEKTDTVSGDTYRKGPAYRGELLAGEYRIEIHTPDNVEKYMLAVGENEDLQIGYIERIHRLLQIKEFYGKSRFLIIESPYVYIPVLIMSIFGGCFWFAYRKNMIPFIKREIAEGDIL